MEQQLLQAVQSGDISTVKTILYSNKSLHINYRDEQGKTALHYAVINDYKYIAKLLLEEGAFPNCVDNDSEKFPIDMACSEAMKYVLQRFGGVSSLLIAGAAIPQDLFYHV